MPKVIVPYYLGSDPNEQAHAFVRTSQFAGRRTNLDCSTLRYGLEKLNIRSSLPGQDKFQIAHTRGRTVFKKAVETLEENGAHKVWYGKDLNVQSLRSEL